MSTDRYDGSVPPAPAKLLLTVEESCEALGVRRADLYRLFKGKQHTARLASVKVGGRRLIPVTALQAFAARWCEEMG